MRHSSASEPFDCPSEHDEKVRAVGLRKVGIDFSDAKIHGDPATAELGFAVNRATSASLQT